MESRLDLLPYEMITYIFLYLPYVAILRVCRVYPQFAHLLKDEHFWEQKCVHEVGCSCTQFADTYGDAHCRYLRMISIGPLGSFGSPHDAPLSAGPDYIEEKCRLSVSEGSEMYLPIDKCLRRALRLRDNNLINYFLARFPIALDSDNIERFSSCVRKTSQRGFRKLALHLLTTYRLDPNIALLGGALGNDLEGIDCYIEAGADPITVLKCDRLSMKSRDYLFRLDFNREVSLLAYTKPGEDDIIERIASDGKKNLVISLLRDSRYEKDGIARALVGASRGGQLELLTYLIPKAKAHHCLFATLEAIENGQTDCAILLLQRYPTNSVVPLIRASILGNVELLYFLTSMFPYSIEEIDSVRRLTQYRKIADILEIMLSSNRFPIYNEGDD